MSNLIAERIQEVLSDIGACAHAGDTGKLLKLSQYLQELKQLEEKQLHLNQLIESALANGFSNKITEHPSSSFTKSSDTKSDRTGSFAKGRLYREKLLKELQENGTPLRRAGASKTIYQTLQQKMVGVAFGTELSGERWFLGIKHHDFQCVILMCESNSGVVHKFFVPGPIYRRCHKKLLAADGNPRFNVRKQGNVFELVVPNESPIALNRYKDEFNALEAA